MRQQEKNIFNRLLEEIATQKPDYGEKLVRAIFENELPDLCFDCLEETGNGKKQKEENKLKKEISEKMQKKAIAVCMELEKYPECKGVTKIVSEVLTTGLINGAQMKKFLPVTIGIIKAKKTATYKKLSKIYGEKIADIAKGLMIALSKNDKNANLLLSQIIAEAFPKEVNK